MRLFIAEKPSLAKAIADGLGGGSKHTGYIQCGNDKVTHCFGHMLELFDPDDYDEKYKQWNMSDLPIPSVYPPTLKPKADSKSQFDVIVKLIEEADSIVHAGDPDDEGQLLVDEILTHVRNTKPVQRLLIADLNLKPVQKALASLKPNSEFEAMGRSALARSIGDQLFGYNLTRAFTLQGRKQGFDGVLNVGRVQSAVLGLVNARTLANQNHQESYYYDVSGQFALSGGHLTAKYQTTDNDLCDEKGRIIDPKSADAVKTDCEKQDALITEVQTKEERKAPPLPYNLSTLQQVCAKQFGYSADDTLNYMQSLYETHKLLTYPRTDCRYLSDEHFANRELILGALSHDHASELANIDIHRQHKAFNAEKITAHHAIVPTEKSAQGITLNAGERNIYKLVCESFIALFYPDSVRDKTRVTLNAQQGRSFVATQSVIKSAGWEVLFKQSGEEDKPIAGIDLRTLSEGTNTDCDKVTITKKKTQPPKYFVESTLLAAMTRAAKYCSDPELRKTLEAKDKDNAAESGSIGTEATRASILAKLKANTNLISIEKEKGYKEAVWKTTKQGQELCAALPPEVLAPDTSAIWSGKQADIKAGNMTVEAFIADLDTYLEQRIDAIKSGGINITSNMIACPTCKKGHLRKRNGEKGTFWGCNRYPDCKATFPDQDGKPNFNAKPKRAPIVSEHACPTCGKGLIRRSTKKGGKIRFFWSCSGFPECKTTLFDSKGKPNFDSAR